MTKLLNFKTNRSLGFKVGRPLLFNLNRELDFNLNRELDFNPDRDLGFGKRGKLFRGYICSNCGALATTMAKKCDECDAVFEAPEQPSPSRSDRRGKKAEYGKRFCIFCGNRIGTKDRFCRTCGLRNPPPPSLAGETAPEKPMEKPDYEKMKLPRVKEKKVVVELSKTGKNMKDYLEK